MVQGGYPNHIIALLLCTGCPKNAPIKQTKTVKHGRLVNIPKWSEMASLDVFYHWDPFGPVWTLLDHFKQKMIVLLKSTSAKPNFVLIKQQIDFCLKWPKSRGLILYTIHYFS